MSKMNLELVVGTKQSANMGLYDAKKCWALLALALRGATNGLSCYCYKVIEGSIWLTINDIGCTDMMSSLGKYRK